MGQGGLQEPPSGPPPSGPPPSGPPPSGPPPSETPLSGGSVQILPSATLQNVPLVQSWSVLQVLKTQRPSETLQVPPGQSESEPQRTFWLSHPPAAHARAAIPNHSRISRTEPPEAPYHNL